MINETFAFTKKELNQYLLSLYQTTNQQEFVICNNIVEDSGSGVLANANKVVITLINLENETYRAFAGGQNKLSGQNIQMQQPAALFNLDMLFTANFDKYETALKFLTATIAFFQANPTFTPERHPNLPDGLKKLTFEIENAAYEKTHNLWNSLGAKYKPSIIYKARHVSIDAEQVFGEASSIHHASHSSAKPSS